MTGWDTDHRSQITDLMPQCLAAALAAAVRFAPFRVFWTSMAMVIGPTPPGTGVMNEAFSETYSRGDAST